MKNEGSAYCECNDCAARFTVEVSDTTKRKCLCGGMLLTNDEWYELEG